MRLWPTELDEQLQRHNAHQPVPPQLLEQLLAFDLADTNQEISTFGVMRRMADVALAMTLQILPSDAADQALAHVEKDTPQAYLQIAGIVLCVATQQPLPTNYARACTSTLLHATRPIAADRSGNVREIQQIRTSAFLAMWTVVYSEHCEARSVPSGQAHIQTVFG